MKLGATILSATLALFLVSTARTIAAPVEAREPVALGLDVGTTASSALMGAVAGSVCLDLPVAHQMSLTFSPSVYWASGTDVSVLQLTMIAMMRFYPVALFVNEAQAHWGPFVAAGAAVAWAQEQSGATLNVVSFGPDVEVGYRLVFGDRGIFVEPTFGWMALYGGLLDSSGASATMNSGFSAGFTLGYRF